MFIARIALNEISAAEAACLSASKGANSNFISVRSRCALGLCGDSFLLTEIHKKAQSSQRPHREI